MDDSKLLGIIPGPSESKKVILGSIVEDMLMFWDGYLSAFV